MNISVIGAGAWGTALAISLAKSHKVTLWARDAGQVSLMQASHQNSRYLPDIALPEELILSADLGDSLAEAELVIIAVPTAALRPTLQRLALARLDFGVLWLCKGFESGTSLLPHQIVSDILPESAKSGVLSGPSFAQEVANGLPAALTLAANDESFAKAMSQMLHHSRLRIYPSSDVIGVEVGGAIKNVLAIAAGISDGLGLGLNARAALITRGLAEITRLGLKMGGRPETIAGLSGLGDLILTCTGDLSRNRKVGVSLAQNQGLEQILSQLGHVAEGVYTAREVHHLAQKLDVEMPISEAVYRVIYEQKPATEMVTELLSRAPNLELNRG
jgi:glycerol-3-phosphate dehydrogenase (NAD(P)+)